MSIESRLLARRKLVDNHWLWTGPTNFGYGVMSIKTRTGHRMVNVHRISAMLYLNLDLENPTSFACHKLECKNRLCFNPEHLYIGTNETNMQDRFNPITHCKHGHKFTPENTYYRKDRKNPNRQCKICRRNRKFRYAREEKQCLSNL